MSDELQNNIDYVKSVLGLTREKLAHSIFTITELETQLVAERQLNEDLRKQLSNTSPK